MHRLMRFVVLTLGVLGSASQRTHADDLPQVVLDIQTLQLSSLNGEKFAFQFYRTNKDSKHNDRWWASANDTPVAITFVMSRFPLAFRFHNSTLLFTPERILRQSPASSWCNSVDGHLLAYGENTVPPGGKSFVAIDLPSCLDTLIADTPPELVEISFQAPRTWHFKYRDNVSAKWILRTPNDSIALGTPIGRWHVQTTPEVEMGISALTINSQMDLFVEDVDLALNPIDVAELPSLSRDDLLSDDGRRSQDGYRTLASLSTVSVEEHFSEKREARQIIRELESRILAEGEIRFSNAWIRDFCSLCNRLRVYASLENNNELPIDDPAVRWSRIEQILEVKLFFAAEQILLEILLNQPTISLEDRIRLVDARADLGESQFLHRSTMFDAKHGELYRSILNAHHQHPWTNADILRCHDYLEKVPENSPASHCLIESLILMGEIEKLSPDLVDRWYGDVIFAGTREDQLELLRQITLVPSGREWLRKRLAMLEGQLSDSDHLALHALEQRATATQKTSRWDFMSEQECKTTQSLVEKLGLTR